MVKNYLLCLLVFFIIFSPIRCGTPLKIALVKQVVYQDLYACTSNNPKEVFASSLKRSGPIALFTKFDTDFYIVDVEPDQECQTWKEKALVCKQKPLQYYLGLAHMPVLNNKVQGEFSVSVKNIDWSKYDIVISLDISIPARITKQYPKTLWCYYVGEGTQPSFRKSLINPIEGYDCFLNQDFKYKTSNKDHVIEFPYLLQYHPCFEDFLSYSIPDIEKQGIFFECHTAKYLLPKYSAHFEKFYQPIIKAYGSAQSLNIESMVKQLMHSKYFVVFVPRNSSIRHRFRGNAIIEAVATGNLVLAKKDCLVNSDFLTSNCCVSSLQDLLKKIDLFENDKELFKKELAYQRKMINFLCFERPIQHLLEKHKQKLSKLGKN